MNNSKVIEDNTQTQFRNRGRMESSFNGGMTIRTYAKELRAKNVPSLQKNDRSDAGKEKKKNNEENVFSQESSGSRAIIPLLALLPIVIFCISCSVSEVAQQNEGFNLLTLQ